jgi:iron complex outermembrane receptor protein
MSRLAFTIAFSLIVAMGIAQPADTSLLLDEVLVRDTRLRWAGTGHRVQMVDSTRLSAIGPAPLASLLEELGIGYVKNYGPGQLATHALRGGNANHTAIFWNGLPLQHPMLGQVDLSLLPLVLADEVEVDYGSSSSLWGSGAVGGSIHLASEPGRQAGWGGSLLGRWGSFHAYDLAGSLAWSGNSFSSRTKFFWRDHRNDFPYRNAFGEERRLPHAHQSLWGLIQELRWQAAPGHRLGLDAWYQASERQLPPTTLQESSRASQYDESLRLAAHWQWTTGSWSLHTRTGAFFDQLDYTDPAADIRSESQTANLLLETEARWQLSSGHQLRPMLQVNHQRATASNFEANTRQTLSSLGLAWHGAWRDWQVVAALRQGLLDGRLIPFLPSLRLDWKPVEQGRLFLAVDRSFRAPTLNDRFWVPGGNPALQPKESWSQEGGLEWTSEPGRFGQHQAQFSGFSRLLNQWIQWIPLGEFWSPQNLKRVWSRGLEVSHQSSWQWSAIRLQLESRYEWVRSTNVNTGDKTENKQLIYTPVHQGQIGGSLSWNAWQLHYRQQWTGRVFLTADHSDELPGFTTGHLRLQWSRPIGSGRLAASIELRNLWDTEYQVVANRPMPGRNLALQLQWHFHHTKSE